ncbi:MAG: 50S ribosomal protein L30 [Bacteroidales bacterium]|nr:50S ribosomal protein L30 [Bacteroidales bacterium]
MKKIRIKQIKSGIGRSLRQKRTLRALGFRKMHQCIELEVSPQIMGMVEKVQHLLIIEEI